MRNIVNEYIRMFGENRRVRRKTEGLIAILALLVAAGVFWNLHFTGIALTGEVYYCGKEEHQHGEECYAWVLNSTTDTATEENAESEPGETTTETDGTVSEEGTALDAATETETEELPEMVLCAEATETEEWYLEHGYEKVLSCGKVEHAHTIDCILDETADVETAEDWEATLPDELDGTAAENLVTVAVSQLGYTESTHNFSLADDGETRNGYTRYGAWYGDGFEYVDWDAMFAAFCLHYAGISEEDFPINSGAYAWAANLSEAGLYVDAEDYMPEAGDLVFFDTDSDGKADKVGIVEAVETVEDAAEDDTANEDVAAADVITLTVIVGDYSVDDDLGTVNGNGDSTDSVCRLEVTSDNGTILGYGTVSGNTQMEGFSEQTLTVTVEDMTVTICGLLPDGATVSAEPVELDLEDQEVQFALEIAIYDVDGKEFEPENDTITVTVESENITDDCVIYYVPDEGDLERISSEAEDGSVSFDAAHFSTYAGLTLEVTSLAASADSLNFYLVDDNGTALLGTSAYSLTYSSSLESWLPVQTVVVNYIIDAASSNSNYLYSGAHLTNYDGTEIIYIKYDTGSSTWRYSTSTTLPSASEDGTEINGDVYLVFSLIESTESEDIIPGYSKYVADNGDGTYNLTLNVTASDSETEKTKVDIIYIMDVSGSMIRSMTSTDYDDVDKERKERLDAANSAIVTLTNELAKDENIDAQFSLTVFAGENYTTKYYHTDVTDPTMTSTYESGYRSYSSYHIAEDYVYEEEPYNDGKLWIGWTSSATDFIKNLPEDVHSTTRLGIATNYEAGIYHAQEEVLDSTREDAVTVVIFLSDGQPTLYYLDDENETYTYTTVNSYTIPSGKGASAGNRDESNEANANTCLNEAIDQLTEMYETLKVDYFMTVGVGYANFYDRLEKLGYLIKSTDTSTTEEQAKIQIEQTYGVRVSFYEGDTEEKLSKAFSEIKETIEGIKLGFSDVTIEDTLSENVTAVVDSVGSVNLNIEITDENGDNVSCIANTKSVASPIITVVNEYELDSGESFTITATYNKNTKKINMSFSDGYILEDGWTYSVTITVGATEKAYENYYSSGGYPDEGAADTDAPGVEEADYISSGMPGVFTNEDDKAILTYTYNGNENSVEYPMPVIPLDFENVTVAKYGSDGSTTLSGAEFVLYRQDSSGNSVYYKYTENDGTTSWVSGIDSATTLTSDTDGLIVLYNLYSESTDNGNEVYYLKETGAPEGYSCLTDPVYFRVSCTGTLTLSGSQSNVSTGTITTSEGTIQVLQVTNTVAEEYDITIQKLDEDGYALTSDSAVFYLYKEDGNDNKTYYYYSESSEETSWVDISVEGSEATRISTDSTEGKASVYHLTGNTTYYLQEIYAPYGYELLEEPIELYLTDDGTLQVDGSTVATVAADDAGNLQILQITNKEYEEPLDITIRKIDSTSGDLITASTAKFYLYREDADGNYVYYTNDGSLTEWVDSSSAEKLPTTAGEVTVSDLYPETYYLQEISAPSGYATLSQVIMFTLSGDGKITVNEGDSFVAVDDEDLNALTISVKNSPTDTVDVTVMKYKEDGTTGLAGAVFRMYTLDSSGNTQYYKYIESSESGGAGQTTWVSSDDDATELSSDSDGSITLHGLTGNTTYYLEETEAPYGYALLSDPIVFTVTATGSTGNVSYSLSLESGDNDELVSVDASNTLLLNVKNEKAELYDLVITKKKTGTDTTIQGAGFYLYRVVKNSEGNDVKYYWKYETGNVVSWVEDIEDAIIKTTGNKGTLSFLDLPPGTYYLYEAVVPDGYNSLEADISITIDDEGNLSLNDDIDYAEIEETGNTYQVRLIVYNTPGYELPSAGGVGIVPYTGAGLLLTGSAAWLMYKQKRRRRERVRGG